MTLAKHHANLRFVVEDREPVLKDAVTVGAFVILSNHWLTLAASIGMLTCLASSTRASWNSKVRMFTTDGFLSDSSKPVQDFFEPQPIKNANVFLLRMILHDWSDKYCAKILRHLRDAAAPYTQLVIVDNLLSYACVDDSLKDIPGAEVPLPPAPLLPNSGHAAAIAYWEDLLMLQLMNGKERTIADLRVLLEQTGWKLVRIVQGALAAYSTQKAIAVPV